MPPDTEYRVNLVVMQDPWAYVTSGYMGVLILLLAVFFILIPVANKILEKLFKGFKGWSLLQALSLNPKAAPPKPASGAAGNEQPPVSSLSRLIAFVGVLVLVPWCVTVLSLSSYWYARTGEVPDMSKLTTFFVALVGFFFPYLASKVADAIKSR